MNIVDPKGNEVGTLERAGNRWVVKSDDPKIRSLKVVRRSVGTPNGAPQYTSIDNVEVIEPTEADYDIWFDDALAILGYTLE